MKVTPDLELFQNSNHFDERSKTGASEFIVWASLFLCVVSAWFTAFIGVHSIFGAFLAGLCIPRDQGIPKKIIQKIEDLVNVLFLPLVSEKVTTHYNGTYCYI